MNKLTETQYYELQAQYDRLPDLSTPYANSGEHYQLMALLGRLGYRTNTREQAIELAGRLLSNGHN